MATPRPSRTSLMAVIALAVLLCFIWIVRTPETQCTNIPAPLATEPPPVECPTCSVCPPAPEPTPPPKPPVKPAAPVDRTLRFATDALPWGDTKLLEVLWRVSVNNTVILAVANSAFCDFAVNLALSVQKLGVSSLLVPLLTPTENCTTRLEAAGATVFVEKFGDVSFSESGQNFGEGQYDIFANLKVLYAARIVRLGFHVLVTDTDTYWNKNALELLNDGADLNLAADRHQDLIPGCPTDRVLTFGAEPPGCTNCDSGIGNICWTGGFYFVRATPGGVRYIMALLRGIQNNVAMEQFVMGGADGGYVQKQPDVIGHVTYWHLHEAYIVSGMCFNAVGRCPDPAVYYVAHANYAIGTESKLEKMKVCNMWLLP